MTTLTLTDRKGGVAKTTSTANLAAELAAAGHRVLCCDLDPQASLTLCAGHTPDEIPDEQTSLAALLSDDVDDLDVDEANLCVPAPWGGELMRANENLSLAENLLTQNVAGPHQRLRTALAPLSDRYDFVLVDSPPSMGKLVLNAMCAADHLLVPVASDFVSVGGLDRLFKVVAQVRKYERADLSVLGVFATRARHTLHHRETLEMLGKLVGDLLMEPVVPEAIAVQDAQASYQAVRDFAPGSPAAVAYARLAREILARLNGKSSPVAEAA